MLIKNSFGISVVLRMRESKNILINTFTGSSLDRKKITEAEKQKRKDSLTKKMVNTLEVSRTPEAITYIELDTGEEKTKSLLPKLRSMSQHTKSKIRKKLMAFAQLSKKLTFVTLTFVNKVEDQKAVLILKRFLDNMKKGRENFDYLWVAEHQTNNPVFKDNIHFHLITNKFWNIEKTLKYWINLQAKKQCTATR